MNPQPDIDWPAIREAYEEGFLALPDIAEAHGVAPEEIAARAQAEAWPRLTMDIQSIGMRGATVTERILGISSTRFFDLQQEGVIEPIDGKYNVLKTVRAVVRYFMAAAAGRTPGKLEQLKIEAEAEKVATLRQRREMAAGKLVPIGDVEETLKAVLRYIQDEMTDRSAKISYELADEHEPGVIKLRLEQHDRAALDRVAARIHDTLCNPLGTPEPASGTPDTAQPVGRPPSKAAALVRREG